MPVSKSFDFTDSNYDSNNTSRKWDIKMHWKSVAIIVGIILLLLSIFFGGFYAGRTSVLNSLDTGAEPEVGSSTEAPAHEIDWDGFCPRRSGICPTSYRGVPLLLLISMDGFRPDYLERGHTPTLYKLSQCGTKAPFIYPVFPSKTFPNHYSQVTGLNPVSHGIVDNNMYDPSNRKVFKVGNAESLKPYWWSADPIWVTAQKEGKKSGCFFWPGSEVKINSTFPTYYKKYNSKTALDTRVRTILSWIDMPVSTRPSFYTLYVNQPDHAAHANGTGSESVNIQLKRVDDMIAMLFAGIQERDLLDCINIIMVSDHGMADTSCDKMLSFNDYVNISEVHSVVGPFGRLRPKGVKNTTAEQNILESLQCRSDHMRAYRKENLPVRYHYASNSRIEPLFLDLDSGWMISNYKIEENSSFCQGGNHGYDNWFPDMQAFFMAIGPSFKSNHSVEPFLNTELYELMTELMNITAMPNNGTKGSLHHLLNDPEVLPAQPTYSPPRILDMPSDSLEIEMNIRSANCSLSQVVDALNMNDSDMGVSRSRHLPFGIPHRHFDSETLYLLYQPDYISAFDVKYKLPLWTAYTTSKKVNFTVDEPEWIADILVFEDWIADARINYEDSMKCSFYKDPKVVNNSILQRPLFPLSFAQEQGIEAASLVTNSVPKTEDHVNAIEKTFLEMLSEWAKQKGSINVITGPAFDLLYTGVYPEVGRIMQTHDKYGPLVVPTHYYAIVTWCKNALVGISDCKPSDIDVVSFLLPNDPVPYNCESSKDKINKNAARVADIETLTGISFFTELPVYDAIRLRTSVPERNLAS